MAPDVTFTNSFSSEIWLYFLLSLHVATGILGAFVAARKGRDLKLWLALGIPCGIGVLLVALVMKRKVS